MNEPDLMFNAPCSPTGLGGFGGGGGGGNTLIEAQGGVME